MNRTGNISGIFVAVAIATTTMLPVSIAAANGNYDVIVWSGDAAHGTTGVFASFGRPVVNASGQIAYRAFLETGVGGVGLTNDGGLWRGSTLIAREGSAAGGISGGIFDSFLDPVLGDGGHVGYLAFLRRGPGGVLSSNDIGIWRDTALIAREGSAASGTAGVFQSFDEPRLNANGDVAYRGSLLRGVGGVTSDNNSGIWQGASLVARKGDVADGTTGVHSNLTNPGINNSGQVLFESSLRIGVGGVTGNDNDGIWLNSDLVVREGDPAGGTSGVFSNFGVPLVNEAGDMVFEGFLRSGFGGVDFSNDNGIWRDSTLIAREGSAAGGTPGIFSGFSDPVINAPGQIAYEGFLRTNVGGVSSSDDSGVWLDGSLIAREGAAAAGVPNGAVFDGNFSTPLLNNLGQLLFTNRLRQGVGGVTSENDGGLWLYNPDGVGMLIAREGDTLEGKTISAIDIWAGATLRDGQRSALADNGQLAYWAQFTDGSEAIVRFAMGLHWTAPMSGSWDTATNWTLSLAPESHHDVFIDPSGDYTVSGPANDLTVNRLVIGGGTGIGTLVLNAGVLAVTAGAHVESTGVLTGAGVVDGAVVNRGAIVAHDINITGGLSNQRLVLGTRGTLNRISTDLVNDQGGEVRIRDQESLRLIGNTHDNYGRIEVSESEFEVDGLLTNHAGGRIFAEDATLRFNDGLNNLGQLNITFGQSSLYGGIAVGESGQVVVSSNSAATFFDAITNNGEVRISEGSVVTFEGEVTGAGDFTGSGTKTYESVFSPGQSPGFVLDAGNAIFGTELTVIMEIGGRVQGVEYDHYAVAGDIALGGTLVVSLIDGFIPQAGDTFDLFDWGSASGTFAAFDFSAAGLTPGLQWELDDLYTSGSLAVSGAPVPLPGALWLLLWGLGGLAAAGARRARCTEDKRCFVQQCPAAD